MRKWLKWILIGSGVLLVLCIIVALATGGETGETASTPEPTATATAAPTDTLALTDTPAPTNTAEPTETPEPTNTPASTDTPVLTDTPEPTTTPTAKSDAQLQSYLSEITDISNEYGQAMNEISRLVGEPQIGQDEWTLDVAIQLGTIRRLHEEAQQLDPPDDLQHVHDKMLSALEDADQSTYHIADGIDNMDPAEIEEASRLIQSSNAKIEEATEMLNEYANSQ